MSSVTDQLFQEMRSIVPNQDERKQHESDWGLNKHGNPACNICYRDGDDSCGSGVVYPCALERYLTFVSFMGWHSDGTNCVAMERFNRVSSIAAFDLDVQYRGDWDTGDGLPAFGGNFLNEIFILIKPIRDILTLLYPNPGECIIAARRPTAVAGTTKKKFGVHMYFPDIHMNPQSRRRVNLLLFFLLSNDAVSVEVSPRMSLTNHAPERKGGRPFDQIYDVELDSLRCIGCTKGLATKKPYSVVAWQRYEAGAWTDIPGKREEVEIIFANAHVGSQNRDRRVLDLRKSLLRRICLFVNRGDITEHVNVEQEALNRLVMREGGDEDTPEIRNAPEFKDGVLLVPEGREGVSDFAKDLIRMDPDNFSEKDIELGIPERYEMADSVLQQVLGEAYIKRKNETGMKKMWIYRPKRGFGMYMATCVKGGICAFHRPSEAKGARSRMLDAFRTPRFHVHDSNKTSWVLTPGFVKFYCTQCSVHTGPMVFPYTSSVVSDVLFGAPLPKPVVSRHYGNTNRVVVDPVMTRMMAMISQHRRETEVNDRETIGDLIKNAEYNFF